MQNPPQESTHADYKKRMEEARSSLYFLKILQAAYPNRDYSEALREAEKKFQTCHDLYFFHPQMPDLDGVKRSIDTLQIQIVYSSKVINNADMKIHQSTSTQADVGILINTMEEYWAQNDRNIPSFLQSINYLQDYELNDRKSTFGRSLSHLFGVLDQMEKEHQRQKSQIESLKNTFNLLSLAL